MSENENNFEMLRRLLALKRHEIPPPGYFNRFSGEVIARIHVGEAGESTGDWSSRLLRAFEFRPAFAGAFASALVLLLVFGIVFAERPDSMPQLLLQPMTQNIGGTPQLAAVSPVTLPQSADQTGIIASTNPVLNLQPVAALFGQQNPLFQQVNFSPSGN
jgi:hypothetical protein